MVPEEIRDLVPVDFAAVNLRNSRLKIHKAPNDLQYVERNVEEPKVLNTIPVTGTIEAIYSTVEPKKVIRKQKKGNKFFGAKKSSPLPLHSSTASPRKTMTSLRMERIVKPKSFPDIRHNSNFEKGSLPRFRSHSKIRLNVLTRKTENSLENIKKAIAALPQEIMNVSRDKMDCNENLMKFMSNDNYSRPCTFSVRWPTSDGNPWYWRSVKSQNWELFYT